MWIVQVIPFAHSPIQYSFDTEDRALRFYADLRQVYRRHDIKAIIHKPAKLELSMVG